MDRVPDFELPHAETAAANAADAIAHCPHLTVDPQLRICGGCGEYFPDADAPLFEYVGGMAGTGKTYQMKARAAADPRVRLLATTGIAAVNLGGAQTINSVLRYFDTADMETQYITGKLTQTLLAYGRSGFSRLIVDEVSMMDGRQLDCLMAAILDTNARLEATNDAPIGITLVGDFAQLPPVDAPFVFEQPAWKHFAPHVTILRTIYRQADPRFIAGLIAARSGNVGGVLTAFTPRLKPALDLNYTGTTILATNAEVDRMNALRLLRVKAPDVYLPSYRVGAADSGWRNVPERVQLRKGALVMILRNKTVEGEIVYANGDLGTIEEVSAPPPQIPPVSPAEDPRTWAEGLGHLQVRLLRTGEIVTIDPIVAERSEATGAKGKRRDRTKVLGWIVYMPVRVAYASTVHKSQGLTLDRCQIDLSNHFWTSPGMLYVGLSRCRTLEGLSIVGRPELLAIRCTTNTKVAEWI